MYWKIKVRWKYLSDSKLYTTLVNITFKHCWLIPCLCYYLVLGVDHDTIKAALLWLQVMHPKFLDQHASWGHSDLTVREKRGPVCLDNSHYSLDRSGIMLSTWCRWALCLCVFVCIWVRACVCPYHPGIPALLQKWYKSLSEDEHPWGDGETTQILNLTSAQQRGTVCPSQRGLTHRVGGEVLLQSLSVQLSLVQHTPCVVYLSQENGESKSERWVSLNIEENSWYLPTHSRMDTAA